MVSYSMQADLFHYTQSQTLGSVVVQICTCAVHEYPEWVIHP